MIRLAIYGSAFVAVGVIALGVYVWKKSIRGPPLPKEYIEELRRLDGQ